MRFRAVRPALRRVGLCTARYRRENAIAAAVAMATGFSQRCASGARHITVAAANEVDEWPDGHEKLSGSDMSDVVSAGSTRKGLGRSMTFFSPMSPMTNASAIATKMAMRTFGAC